MTAIDLTGPSPFHEGEHDAQERAGVRDRMEQSGRRMIRDYMPEQHREFYAELPFVLLGSTDARGRPWASLVPGRPGFMSTPDARTLDLSVEPLFGDPLGDNLRDGGDIGLLGIQPATRRRNRLSGRIADLRDGGFTISLSQSFGNCPQYIQTRDVELRPEIDTPRLERPLKILDRFDGAIRNLIENADTLFIASAYAGDGKAASSGVDVSHRGGKPGFVRVEDERTFVFPDYSGNFHFNTVGNIIADPRAGFLFIDFETGDLAYMTGAAEIVWDGEEVEAFAGAERLFRFTVEEAVYVERSLPLRFTFGEYSPVLENTGDWDQTAGVISANAERNTYIDYEVTGKERESGEVTSFYLKRADGKALASYEPGQFLPINLDVPGKDAPVRRTYTLSDAPGAAHYRLSVKREGAEAVASNHLHDRIGIGDCISAMAPRGKFTLDGSSERPVVLLSGGVGITPMIAMANHIAAEGRRTRHYRRTFFIHGARNGEAHAFSARIRELAAESPTFKPHVRYSDPLEGDRLGETYDSEGHIDIELLQRILPLDDYEFYLCGPPAFMQALYDGLTRLGVREERINYESFGPATLLKTGAKQEATEKVSQPSADPVDVRFETAEKTVQWTSEKGTLLDLAEEAGLAPAYSCRSGICGTCATRLKCGAVDYIEEPTGPHEDGEVLICCATPRSASGTDTCGENVGTVLDL